MYSWKKFSLSLFIILGIIKVTPSRTINCKFTHRFFARHQPSASNFMRLPSAFNRHAVRRYATMSIKAFRPQIGNRHEAAADDVHQELMARKEVF